MIPKVPVWVLFFVAYVGLGVFIVAAPDRLPYFMGGAMMLIVWLVFETGGLDRDQR